MFRYDERGKRDPFRSFKWEHLALAQKHDAMRGPLEQFDVAQLSLVAVVWKTGSPKALVSDPSGHAYVVGAGSRIGKNRGRVVTIDDNLVLIKETYVDYLGHETTKDIEIAGALGLFVLVAEQDLARGDFLSAARNFHFL